jgi:PhnB protein
MQLSTSVSFNGQCKEAFTFYAKCLGGKIQVMMTWGESPMSDHVKPEWHDKIIHTNLVVGQTSIMGSDAPPEMYEKAGGFSVAIHTEDPAEAERVFNALSEGGTIQMPLQQTFWATRFGMTVDRFGIPWMVNCGNAS